MLTLAIVLGPEQLSKLSRSLSPAQRDDCFRQVEGIRVAIRVLELGPRCLRRETFDELAGEEVQLVAKLVAGGSVGYAAERLEQSNRELVVGQRDRAVDREPVSGRGHGYLLRRRKA